MLMDDIIMYEHIKLDNLPVSLQAIAEVIGIEQTLKLCSELGGEQFYIPKLNNLISVENRNKKIAEEYDGHNARKLARKYGITSRQLYYIIKNEKG